MDAREHILATIRAEIAEMEAADAAVAAGLATRGNRRTNAASVVFSIRLAPGEIAALERRAAATGIKPSVLARNLVRGGLRHGDERAELRSAIDRIEKGVRELRSLAG